MGTKFEPTGANLVLYVEFESDQGNILVPLDKAKQMSEAIARMSKDLDLSKLVGEEPKISVVKN